MKVKLGSVIMGCLVMLAASSWAQPGMGPGGGVHLLKLRDDKGIPLWVGPK
jgi:hypothetical protein